MMCMSKYKTNKITKFILNLHNVLCGSFILGIYLPRLSKAVIVSFGGPSKSYNYLNLIILTSIKF